MDLHHLFMRRALRLASNAGPQIKLNPPVACLIVYRNRIIGEGFHQCYGHNHAEINALNSVADEDKKYLSESTVYVTLEPCSHYGKTPPCAERLVNIGIKRIFIGCQDPNPKVSGRGIDLLKDNGIEVISPFMESKCRALIHHFLVHIEQKRPFLCLKWAQSHDGFIGKKGKRIFISGKSAQFQVHQWRAGFQAILVGSGTVLTDNPSLDNRLMPGSSPDRIILDRRKRLSGSENVFREDGCRVFYCTTLSANKNLSAHIQQIVLDKENFLSDALSELYKHRIASILVEGGAKVLNAFLDAGLYDQIRCIKNKHDVHGNIKAPIFSGRLLEQWKLDNDQIFIAE